MGKLTKAGRDAIPTSEFAGPNRSYPIQDRGHAKAALSFAGRKGGAIKERVDAAVHRKYPDMGGGSKRAAPLKHERGVSRGFINRRK